MCVCLYFLASKIGVYIYVRGCVYGIHRVRCAVPGVSLPGLTQSQIPVKRLMTLLLEQKKTHSFFGFDDPSATDKIFGI